MNSKLIKIFLRNIVYESFSFLNKFVPKQNKIFIYGDYCLKGNSEAIFRYLLQNCDYPIVCSSRIHLNYEQSSCVRFIKSTKLNVAFEMLTSRVVIDSSLHSIKMKPTSHQLYLQLWHGSPLKYLMPTIGIKNGDYYSKICYASDLFKPVLRDKEFQTCDDKMLLMGQPSNDYFFQNWKMPEKFSFDGKCVLWLPTYRHWGIVAHTSNDIPILNGNNVKKIDECLRELNVKIFLKPHPLQTKSFSESVRFDEITNICLIDDKMLMNQNIPLYAFLSNMDALITDYSSVMFDFLLKNRPIGFTLDDFEEYSKNVGFCIENSQQYMAGQKILNEDDFVKFIKEIAEGRDDYEDRRMSVSKIVNHFQDGKNSERCSNLIRDFIKKYG